jgi:hypothetical protein
MGKIQGICGVNFSTLKKFANFCFNNSVVNTKLMNEHTFVIYIDKSVYDSNKELVDEFENEFVVTIKGQE